MLFIPGNAGTYQQGNGLAAESARQWDRARRRDSGFRGALRDVVNLDWYLVDTREQLSAFHGDVLVSDSVGHGGATYLCGPHCSNVFTRMWRDRMMDVTAPCPSRSAPRRCCYRRENTPPSACFRDEDGPRSACRRKFPSSPFQACTLTAQQLPLDPFPCPPSACRTYKWRMCSLASDT